MDLISNFGAPVITFCIDDFVFFLQTYSFILKKYDCICLKAFPLTQ